ncbi:MAG: cell division protein FtsK [Gammaproteobacteria bacterium]|nr:cell division protein FtsK [Gammaproteobacteria bacterium]
MAALKLSVTQLKCAVVDPQWRQRWLSGENPPTMQWAPPGNGPPVKGKLFHKLVEDFTHWLCHGRDKKAARDLATPEALWHECYDRFVEVELTKLVKANRVESAHHLSQCLQVYCVHLSELRQAVPGFTDWQDLFLGQELPIDGITIGDAGLRVSGRVDAVRRDPQHGIVVVDYKLSRGAEVKHDLVQLAIYAYLLEASKPGLHFIGLLEYYEPEFTPLEVSRGELRDLFKSTVLPVAAELMAQCDRGKITPAVPSPESTESTESTEPELSDRITETFAAFNLNVQVIGRITAPQLVRYRVQPAAGVKVVSLANRAKDLQVSLALSAPPRIEPGPGYVSIDVPKNEPDTVLWRNIQSDPNFKGHLSRMVFPIGLGVEGKLLLADFADPNTCHVLVAGSSGSGKSEFLKSMVASLIKRNGPDSLRLTLIDPKVLTFSGLQTCSYLTGPIVSNLDGAVSCLEQAVKDMENRYQQLSREGFINLGERINAGNTDLPFHVIVFDEFADLVLAGKKEKKLFENLVARLAAKGRAAGIHLVLATQRPDRSIVTGPIKANLPLKVCLKVTSSANSQIILDEPGGEALMGRGDLLCDRGKGIERAQSPFLPPEDMRDLIKSLTSTTSAD